MLHIAWFGFLKHAFYQTPHIVSVRRQQNPELATDNTGFHIYGIHYILATYFSTILFKSINSHSNTIFQNVVCEMMSNNSAG